MVKVKVFVDMDGVLTPFDKTKSLEEISEPGYFKHLVPNIATCKVIKRLYREGYDVRVLSSVISQRAADEKRAWLKEVFSEDFAKRAIFVSYGANKADFVEPETSEVKNILIDDFTYNLRCWNGVGIKAYTGENGTKGTWNGFGFSTKQDFSSQYVQLKAIIDGINESYNSQAS